MAIQKKIRCMCYFADVFCDSCRDANYNFMQTTCRRVPKDKFILQKKITKDKWRITETYITKYILNYRVFHRLNHSLAPNRTGDITFFKTCCHPALSRIRRQIDLPASAQNRNLLLRQMLRYKRRIITTLSKFYLLK